MSSFDHRRLDRTVHSRIRLAVLAILAAVDEARFTFLRDRVKTTDGNLASHLRKLEDAGYVVNQSGGRSLSGEGRALLDRVAGEVMEELDRPDLERYACRASGDTRNRFRRGATITGQP